MVSGSMKANEKTCQTGFVTSESVRDVNLELDVDEEHRQGHREVALRPQGYVSVAGLQIQTPYQ